MVSEAEQPATPHPSVVPGYREAVRAGATPRVPPHPPRLLRGQSARSAFNRFVLLVLGFLPVSWALLSVVGSRGGGLSVVVTALVLTPVAVVVVAKSWSRVGCRNLDELAAGYTTLTLKFGAFNMLRRRRPTGLEAEVLRVPWNYSGIWVLDHKTGQPLQAPDHATLPPGFYPSPNRPECFELWTGEAWASTYRELGQQRR